MTPSVLVFDSGVGGLSVLQHIRQQMPGVPLHYLMDSAAFPYGTKDDELLIQRVVDVCMAGIRELQPAMLVIACNTASTLALPSLRRLLDIPVVGVVPAIKTAASLCEDGCIGLLATPATVHRPYTDDLIRDFAGHCQVSRFGSAELVEWAEDYLETAAQPAGLYDHLQPWFARQPAMSHVVLGCTHFPLLKPLLQQAWPAITWVDSGEAIARRVATLLPVNSHDCQTGPLSCFWTDRQRRRRARRLPTMRPCPRGTSP